MCLFKLSVYTHLCFIFLGIRGRRNAGYVVCHDCGKQFANISNARIHFRDAHSHENGPIVCTLCNKEVKNKSCLRVHMYRNHGIYSPKERWRIHKNHSEDESQSFL